MPKQKGFVGLGALIVIVLGILVLGGIYYAIQQNPMLLSKVFFSTQTTSTATNGSDSGVSATTPKKVLPTSADSIKGDGYFQQNGKIYFYTNQTGTYAFLTGKQPSADWTGGSLEVVGADPSTFVVLDDSNYATSSQYGFEAVDAHHYYQGSQMIPLVGPDASTVNLQTLRNIADGIYKDNHAVYVFNLKDIPDSNQNVIGQQMDIATIQGADPSTFEVIPDQENDGGESDYAKDIHSVYWLNYQGAAAGEPYHSPILVATKISGIDSNTFKLIGLCDSKTNIDAATYGDGYYAEDATHVLANGDVISGADPNTFKIIGEPEADSIAQYETFHIYSVDKYRVYQDCGEVVPNVSPAQCTSDNFAGCDPQSD